MKENRWATAFGGLKLDMSSGLMIELRSQANQIDVLEKEIVQDLDRLRDDLTQIGSYFRDHKRFETMPITRSSLLRTFEERTVRLETRKETFMSTFGAVLSKAQREQFLAAL